MFATVFVWSRRSSLLFAVALPLVAGCFGGGDSATETSLGEPAAVAVASDGVLFVADTAHCTLRRLEGDEVESLIGDGACDDTVSDESIGPITGVAVDAAGAVYASDERRCQVIRWLDGELETLAGVGDCGFAGDGGPAEAAMLDAPAGLALDSSGNLYVADAGNCRVRRISAGVITTIAGSDTCGSEGDGAAAVAATLEDPVAVAADGGGAVYIADAGGCRVRVVVTETVSTALGDGSCEFGEPPTTPLETPLGFPRGTAVAQDSTLYVADTLGCRILAVRQDIVTVAAGDGTCAFGGDDGPATAAQLNQPAGIALAPDGDVYIADTQNCRIRRVQEGVISTVAGNGRC